jgi:alkanesulfonate monooxygenase SsuD/methylene tetrahydromethanopterin reductase-like flavin-dependent oxidoreductase (luciferase family)
MIAAPASPCPIRAAGVCREIAPGSDPAAGATRSRAGRTLAGALVEVAIRVQPGPATLGGQEVVIMTANRPLAVGLTPLETRREVVAAVAMRAERLGYHAMYVAEGWGHDVTVLLAELATRTSTIRLGTGVVNVWGRSAATIAMAANSLAHLSDGRFDLGLGAGSPQLAQGLHDVDFRDPVGRLAATTRQVRQLLAGERLVRSRPGETASLRLATRPDHAIPIHLAGLGTASTRLAGELADGWYPFFLPVSALKARTQILEEGSFSRLERPHICPGIPTAVSADPRTARGLATWWIRFYLTNMGPLYRRTLRELGFGAAVDAVVESAPGGDARELPPAARVLVDELSLCADPGTARESLDDWYRAGADLPVIVLPPNRPLAELEQTLEAFAPLTSTYGSGLNSG